MFMEKERSPTFCLEVTVELLHRSRELDTPIINLGLETKNPQVAITCTSGRTEA